MKQIFGLLLLLMAVSPFTGFAQPKKGYEITGHIESLEEGELLTMKLFYGSGPNDGEITDSGRVKNGQFNITGFVPEGPRMYWLEFNKHKDHWSNLWIDNNQVIRITGGDINKIPSTPIGEYIDIEGSPTNKGRDILVNVERLYLQMSHVIESEVQKIKDSIGFDRSLIEGLLRAKWLLDERYYQMTLSYGTLLTKSMLAYTMVDTWENEPGRGHQFFYKAIYDVLDESAKNSFYGKKLKDIATFSVGQPFPEFTLPTSEGKPVVLKDIVSKSKITLVHFWGSDDFSSEMRRTVKSVQQELKVQYKKYSGKGLDIIGVSADSVAKDWKIRLQVEEYPWVNVSDLKGNLKGSIINDLYHEGGHRTPNVTNVLIDNKGKIIAWDVSGVELQWYLWKYLGE